MTLKKQPVMWLRPFGGMPLSVWSESVRMAGQTNLHTDLDSRDMPIGRFPL